MKEVPIKNVMESFEYLKGFVSDEQLKAFNLACLGLEYPFFRARLFALATMIKDMPKTGTNFFSGVSGTAYLHYFLDDFHFYISMKDGHEDGEGQIQAIGCTDWHNGMSESQSYKYQADPNGSISFFKWTNKGWKEVVQNPQTQRFIRRNCGSGLTIGERAEYYDFSF